MMRCVFRAVLKVPEVPESRMGASIVFQIAGAETAKEIDGSQERREAGAGL